MKKLLAATLSVVAMATMSFAQISVTVSPELVIPIGDMSDAAKVGGGASIRATYDIMPCVAVGVNTGYIKFGKKNSIETTSVPVEAVALYKFDKLGVKGLYAGAEIGANYWKTEVGSTDDSEWKFTAAPVVGYKYAINDNVAVGGDFRYQYGGEKELQHLGVRLGVSYAF